MRILLVEDDEELRGALTRRLRAQGYAVDGVGRRADAELQVELYDYGLVVMDRGLPDGDGLDTLRRWRARGRRTPTLMLTARDRVQDRVEGLHGGADDYLIKPFAMDELLARVGVISRRPTGEQERALRVGDLELHPARAEVRRAGVLIPLRAREFAVLACLVRSRGRVVSRERLREDGWDEGHESVSNVVEVTVSSLRRKLGQPPLIHTRRGFGYVVED